MNMEEVKIDKKISQFTKELLEWWKANKRDFPWRNTKNPYAVILAEFLLKKTTAQQAEKVYFQLLTKYSTTKKLARARIKDLVNMLKPLGMEYKRAELLKQFGEFIENNYGGKIPAKQDELLKIPGVGLYTANAVLSFVYNENVPTVDTNFIRIIQRVFGIKSSKKRAREDKEIWIFAQKLIPNNKSRDFNFAVLDFGALICTAKKPGCTVCPLADICEFNRSK